MKYTSALLFHGPGARVDALRTLPQIGRSVCDPIGDEGLKVDHCREIIQLMQGTPLGDQAGALLIGPMDKAEQKATDVLLKAIEEFDPDAVRPVLYAYDLGSVSNTIKSRCIHRWCPDGPEDPADEKRIQMGFDLVEACLQRDRARVIELLADSKTTEFHEILDACVKALATDPQSLVGDKYDLWQRIRRLARYRYIGKTEILATFVGGG